MALTEAEKQAGREFRASAQAALVASHESDPPTIVIPPFQPLHRRHMCEAQGGKSVSFECREVYQLSPAYGALIPAGRFAFIYKQGRCAACKITARSRAGMLADAYERPPLRRAS